ncbi:MULTISPECIES: exodeoxyribonuclease VII small subunit [Gordonia]|uniref:Exodeoxyribonuclease 7 small subunit n=2 Tax=Gordonia alkanivorans TaxID=84096 RepID=F9VSI6_9ACTN|nr:MULTISPECIES: exodeoxyribonuclease VII small subunit [Gordonia]AZZ82982.1 exodeoxyribonuclease VII small subunit [Gordonia alkanivorans]ETA08693.1 exodeoxyribonuclease VII small subunit [Gordonia alkanivorans CGMCC 6845]MDH3005358.1 exodeoxyribonuclease VII small subunit [Gordonia alkanivorans]MDH3010345.1 exodeoxyribonuclease VII small subunit [Gordonia alkanivorans]MDH3014770.1 exodeoxyribonuclease VII small subunit [Gordonia alkanivorans]
MSTDSDDTGEEYTPVAELGYEEARDELADIVGTLEHGGLDLDTSLALWERGEALATRCEEHLRGARERIETVIAQKNSADPDDNE